MTTLARLASLSLAAAALLAGCGQDNKCSTEPPQVNAVANCSAHPGQSVSLPVRLCPTCNQSGATCNVTVDEANGIIQLDTRVEACQDASSCGGAFCQNQPFACSFTAPSATGSYQILIANGLSGPFAAPDFVVTDGSISCALPGLRAP